MKSCILSDPFQELCDWIHTSIRQLRCWWDSIVWPWRSCLGRYDSSFFQSKTISRLNRIGNAREYISWLLAPVRLSFLCMSRELLLGSLSIILQLKVISRHKAFSVQQCWYGKCVYLSLGLLANRTIQIIFCLVMFSVVVLIWQT